uniref:FMRFamide n=1 Tax=Haemonchus contortus TaxID=6289 RepID=A0A7I4Z6C7_HAECO
MLFVLVVATFVASVASYRSDVAAFPEHFRRIGHNEYRVKAESNNNNGVLNPLVQDPLQRTDTVLNELVEPTLQKRNNDFICSGKRERRNVKRKNEFIRFGKRGDDLVRFGRSDSTETEPHVAKRKNEFIRFG